MAWLETDVMKQRSLFVLDFESGLFSMSELCERYGISRPTGYKWWVRYCDDGLPGLQDRSRRAQSCPHRTHAAVEQALLELRRAHPSWGPVTLLQRLRTLDPQLPLPASSTAAEILHRHGLVRPRKRRPKPRHPFIFITTVLHTELLGLEPVDDGLWSVYFGPLLLGRISERDYKYWEL